MANEHELHRCVTEFMLSTCRYSRCHPTHACLCRAAVEAVPKDSIAYSEAFNSGSSAEFYIKPVLSCIGDIDMMLCLIDFIAIPARQSPPTELSDHCSRIVRVCEIIDSHKPGYVYLQQSYTLKKNDNGRYVVEKKEQHGNSPHYFPNIFSTGPIDLAQNLMQQHITHDIVNTGSLFATSGTHDIRDVQGPALKIVHCTKNPAIAGSTDAVICMRCLVWPPQAADWPTRYRRHSWPDSATINTVVNDGCDVVRAVHRNCRQDEWMSKHQCRLSFSRAEVTLLNSWTPLQQIIYHMLRFVMKREVFTEEYKDPNLPKLCNYHIKTLMLWECEQKPQSWWSAESSLIKLCSSLLHKLSDWVSIKRCQQYFISNCNLLDHFVDDEACLITCMRLKSLADVSHLLSWFVKNYVSYAANTSTLFENNYSSDILQVRAATDYLVRKMPFDFYYESKGYEMGMAFFSHAFRMDNKYVLSLLKELPNDNLHNPDYIVAVISLQVAWKTSINSLTEDNLEILWALFNPCATAIGDKDIDESTSEVLLSIRKAIKLACLRNIRSDALVMLHEEMSKAYLHHSVRYEHESTYCVVHVLLAAVYYKSGHHQAATDHCKQVLNKTACEQYGVRSIGAEYLPQIDESVDAVLGLILLYEQVQMNALNSNNYLQSKNTVSSAFTTELLARCLHSKCSTVVDAKGNEVTVYRQHLFHSHRLLLGDILLFKVTETETNKFNKSTKMSDVEAITHNSEVTLNTASGCMDTSLLVTALQLVALEKLIVVRNVMVRELHLEWFHTLNEFEALYAYKCGLYEECLEMCRSYLNMTLHLDFWKEHHFLVSLPEMLILLEGDLVSLFGIIRLVYPSIFSSFLQHPLYELIHLLTLSLYLMVQCQKKLCLDSRCMYDMLKLIRFVHNEVFSANNDEHVLDRLVLKLIYRSLKMLADTSTCAAYGSVADCSCRL